MDTEEESDTVEEKDQQQPTVTKVEEKAEVLSYLDLDEVKLSSIQ